MKPSIYETHLLDLVHSDGLLCLCGLLLVAGSLITLEVAGAGDVALAVGRSSWDVVEDVSLLSVDPVVSDGHGVGGHPKRDAQDELDEEEDDGGPCQVPSDDKEGADDLEPDLSTIASDGSTGVRHAERSATLHSGEDAGHEAADDGSDEMGVEDAEGVVDVLEQNELLADDVHGDPRDGTREEAHDDGSPAVDESSRGCDGDETGDHALDGADKRGLLEGDDVEDGPGEDGHGGGDVGVDDGDTSIGVGGVLIATKE